VGEGDVDTGELHLRRVGIAQGVRDGGEGGQDLRFPIVEVAQFGGIGPAVPRADTQVVERDIGGGPGEFLARQFRTECYLWIDGHNFSSAQASAGDVADPAFLRSMMSWTAR